MNRSLSSRSLSSLLLMVVLSIGGIPARCSGQGAKVQGAKVQGASARPLKVFVLAGQSNMQGHAKTSTFDAMRLNPKTAPLLDKMRNEDGSPRVCENVWITSIGSSDQEQHGKLTVGFGASARGPKIGPEYTFGIELEDQLDEPALIIKTAWGGKSLNTDFRSPSCGPYEFSEKQIEDLLRRGKNVREIKADRKAATGKYYREMIEHIEAVLSDIGRVCPDYSSDAGYELCGFVWFQGWNDMVDQGTYPNRSQKDGYDQYSECMTHFIRDVRKDLSEPKLSFVIGVMGVGGPTDQYDQSKQRYKSTHQNFRDAMAAPASLAEFKGNVATVLTEDYWDMEVMRLRKREKEIKPKRDEIQSSIKSGSVSAKEGQAAIERIYADAFDSREREILSSSTSNAEYHYLGSAGIMAQIGKGFADAVLKMMRSERVNR